MAKPCPSFTKPSLLYFNAALANTYLPGLTPSFFKEIQKKKTEAGFSAN
jgi:hypothetical protein